MVDDDDDDDDDNNDDNDEDSLAEVSFLLSRLLSWPSNLPQKFLVSANICS